MERYTHIFLSIAGTADAIVDNRNENTAHEFCVYVKETGSADVRKLIQKCDTRREAWARVFRFIADCMNDEPEFKMEWNGEHQQLDIEYPNGTKNFVFVSAI